MFVLLLLVMVLLATTELGTDSWISDIMRTVLQSPTLGTLFLVWTSLIMFVLRFFAGPIVHRISPLGLLAASAADRGDRPALAVARPARRPGCSSPPRRSTASARRSSGRRCSASSASSIPRGGALMLNAIAGVGMISVGTLGNPAIGAVQDRAMAMQLRASDPVVAERVVETRQGLFGASPAVNPAKRADLAAEAAANPGDAALQQQAALLATTDQHTKQGALGTIAILPVIMLACYVGLLLILQGARRYPRDPPRAGNARGRVRHRSRRTSTHAARPWRRAAWIAGVTHCDAVHSQAAVHDRC